MRSPRFFFFSTWLWIMLCWLGWIPDLFGQLPAGATAMEIPTQYILPKANVNFGFSASRLAGAFWQVAADQPEVPYTSEAGGGRTLGTLNILEPIFVYEDQGAFVHVVRDLDFQLEGTFSSQAKDLGWVAKSQLLLWSHCLVSADGSDRNLLKITIPHTDRLKNSVPLGTWLHDGHLQTYQDPHLHQKQGKGLPIGQLVFVYKRLPASAAHPAVALVGIEARTPLGSPMGEVIKGWVAECMLSEWQGQLGLMPNPSEEASVERKAHQRPLRLLASAADAKRYQQGMTPTPGSIWWEESGSASSEGMAQFPLWDQTDGIARLGLMGYLPALEGVAETAEMVAAQKGEVNNSQSPGKDVLLVIGHSESLGSKGFASIVKSIQQSLVQVFQETQELRFGVAVYRDYSAGKSSVSVLPLEEHPMPVIDFLKGELSQTDLGNPDPALAVNAGIQAGLTQTGTQAPSDQLLIVLGDVGNHTRQDPSQVSEDDLIQLLIKHQPDVFLRQVPSERKLTDAPPFLPSLKLATKMSSIQQYQILEERKEGVHYPKQSTLPGNLVQITNGASFHQVKGLSPGEEDFSSLGTELTQVILAFARRHPETRREASVSTPGRNSAPIPAGPTPWTEELPVFRTDVRTALQQQFKLERTRLEALHRLQYPLYLEAFAPFEANGLTHASWEYAGFFTRQKLADLIRDLESLIEAGERPDGRLALQQAWGELLTDRMGYLDPKEAAKMSLPQAGQWLYDLPETHQEWQKIKLGDLMNRRRWKEDDHQAYLRKLGDSKRKLERIFNSNDDPHAFQSGLFTYYWLEGELFP